MPAPNCTEAIFYFIKGKSLRRGMRGEKKATPEQHLKSVDVACQLSKRETQAAISLLMKWMKAVIYDTYNYYVKISSSNLYMLSVRVLYNSKTMHGCFMRVQNTLLFAIKSLQTVKVSLFRQLQQKVP